MTEHRSDLQQLGTAHHEAGHAVVHIVQGMPIDRVFIGDRADHHGGCEHPSPMMVDCEPSERRGVARAMIVASYDGLEAERLVDPQADAALAADDDGSAYDLSCEYSVLPRRHDHLGDEAHCAYLARLGKEAGRLVRKHRELVRAVAISLMRHKELTGQRAEDVMRAAGWEGL